MIVREITEHLFNALVNSRDPMAPFFTQECAWFASDGGNVVGAVIFDRMDKDWAYVVLERAKDKRFDCVDAKASIDSQEGAAVELMIAMKKRIGD